MDGALAYYVSTGTSNKSSKAVETENRNRKFAKENSWVKFEHSKELKSHQERVRKMKPCIHTTSTIVNHPRPFQSHIRKRDLMQEDKLRLIEKQNYQLLKRLRYIHKTYSLYMPKKRYYLIRGEAFK
ncbi:unnamed protein product [Sphagnum tenellum]